QVLALIEEGGVAAPKATAAAAASGAKPGAAAAEADGGRDSGKLSPSVRRLIEENHLDPAAIPASGRDGRLTKSDVVDFLGKRPPASVRAPAPRPAAPAGARAEQRSDEHTSELQSPEDLIYRHL